MTPLEPALIDGLLGSKVIVAIRKMPPRSEQLCACSPPSLEHQLPVSTMEGCGSTPTGVMATIGTITTMAIGHVSCAHHAQPTVSMCAETPENDISLRF